MTDFFEAELDTPIPGLPITHKILNSFTIQYDSQKAGGALARATIVCVMDFWNMDGDPVLIEPNVTVLIENGPTFFAGNASVAADLRTVLQERLIAGGVISADDIWTLAAP